MLAFLYRTPFGRMLLKLLTRPGLSKVAGRFCDSPFSKFMISSFVRHNQIDLAEYEDVEYKSFNQFFCRKILPELRPVDPRADALIAPCDGLLSAYRITNDLVIPVKGSHYRITDLLRDRKLAAAYEGGTCLVFRLCVNHYHRYIYLDSGIAEAPVAIDGILHTVRPIALRNVPVFTENSREYTVLYSDHFGTVIQMEVGAMLVGRICNHPLAGSVRRGQEKGYFEYGGSTIIVLIEKDQAAIASKYFQRTAKGAEVPVKLGQKLTA